VRISGSVGCDSPEGENVELRGEHAEVIAGDPTYHHSTTGEPMVAVSLDEGGALVSVPEGALRREVSVFSLPSRAFARGWELLFGKRAEPESASDPF